MSSALHDPWPGDQARRLLTAGLGERLERRAVPGVAIAIVARGQTVETVAAGRRNDTDPIEPHTRFEVASLSKPVFAHTVLTLSANGVLDLDAPLRRCFPNGSPPREAWGGLDPSDAQWPQITARHVLSHTSGMGNWEPGRINRIATAPGQTFAYSGEAYILLQRAVEERVGAPLESLAREHTLDPLDMHDSSFVWDPSAQDRTAVGRGVRNDGAGRHWPQARSAFSLTTTAPDYGRFWQALLASADPAFAAMRANHSVVTADVAWGLGVGLERNRDHRWPWQWGDLGDVTSIAIGDPTTGRGVVALTNGAEGLLVCRFIVRTLLAGDHPCFAEVILRADPAS